MREGNEDNKPHLCVPTLDGNAHVIPTEVFDKIISGEMKITDMEAIPRGEADEIAALMSVSEDTINRWCRKPLSDEDHDATGRRNPVDYFLRLLNALYVRNPEGAKKVFDRIMHERATLRQRQGHTTQASQEEIESTLRQIGRELDEMADSIAKDNRYPEKG